MCDGYIFSAAICWRSHCTWYMSLHYLVNIYKISIQQQTIIFHKVVTHLMCGEIQQSLCCKLDCTECLAERIFSIWYSYFHKLIVSFFTPLCLLGALFTDVTWKFPYCCRWRRHGMAVSWFSSTSQRKQIALENPRLIPVSWTVKSWSWYVCVVICFKYLLLLFIRNIGCTKWPFHVSFIQI